MIYVLIWTIAMMTNDGSGVAVATHSQEFIGLEACRTAKDDLMKQKPPLSVLDQFYATAECYEKGSEPGQPARP